MTIGYVAHLGLSTYDTAYRTERALVLGILRDCMGDVRVTRREAPRILREMIAAGIGICTTAAQARAAWSEDHDGDDASDVPVYVIRPADLVETSAQSEEV